MRETLLTIVCAALLAASAAAQDAAPAPQTQEVRPPAEGGYGFRLKGLDGKTYDSESLRGEVLVVSFGATWCVPCTWELVAVEELKVEYKGKPVRFFWVSIEDEKSASDNILRHYAKERLLTIPVLRDPGAAAFSQFSKTTRVPLVVFYDREGRFVAPAHRGMSQDITLYKQMVRRRVDALLAARPAAPAAEGEGKAAAN
ncbi:MAG TPA: TlpA disulfide reductase family protein [Pyrinomonadaceae bacterium]|nr:TlpA disulfide reductase family protein [Pyrinomonadaceae bacterium]